MTKLTEVFWRSLKHELEVLPRPAFWFHYFQFGNPLFASDELSVSTAYSNALGIKIESGNLIIKCRTGFCLENSDEKEGQGFPVPVLRKFIEITDKNSEEFHDSIRIDVRLDFGPLPNTRNLGTLTFQRRSRLSSRYEAVLTVPYRIEELIPGEYSAVKDSFLCCYLESNYDQPVVIQKTARDTEDNNSDTRFPQEETLKAMVSLSDLGNGSITIFLVLTHDFALCRRPRLIPSSQIK